MDVVNDSQVPDVIRENSVIMKHPILGFASAWLWLWLQTKAKAQNSGQTYIE